MKHILENLKLFYINHGGQESDLNGCTRIHQVLKKIATLPLGGGGDSNIFEVHYTLNDGNLVCLETKDQIIEAIENNKNLIGKMNWSDEGVNGGYTFALSQYFVADAEGTKGFFLKSGGVMDGIDPFDSEEDKLYTKYASISIIHTYLPDSETGEFKESITQNTDTIYAPYTVDISENSNNEWTFYGNTSVMYDYYDNSYAHNLSLRVQRQKQRYVLNYNGRVNRTDTSTDAGYRFCGMVDDKLFKVFVSDNGDVTVTEYSLS